jgi:hypothetical protein
VFLHVRANKVYKAVKHPFRIRKHAGRPRIRQDKAVNRFLERGIHASANPDFLALLPNDIPNAGDLQFVTVPQIKDFVIREAESGVDCDPLDPRFEVGSLFFGIACKYCGLILESREIRKVAVGDEFVN